MPAMKMGLTAALCALVMLQQFVCSNAVGVGRAADGELVAQRANVDLDEYREFKQFLQFEQFKRLHRLHGQRQQPPPIDDAALMARYIVNQAGWTSVATVSSRKDTEGYPFVNIIALSDGPLGNGTGVLYLFLTPLDFTAQDVYKDNRATLMVSLAQGRYCELKNYDPMDPRCARVIFSGKIKAVKSDNPEYATAKSAMFGRHPWLSHMPEDHHFFFAKLKIATIALLDTFGGPKYITVEDYLNPPSKPSHD